jgi:hypothetical protein
LGAILTTALTFLVATRLPNDRRRDKREAGKNENRDNRRLNLPHSPLQDQGHSESTCPG